MPQNCYVPKIRVLSELYYGLSFIKIMVKRSYSYKKKRPMRRKRTTKGSSKYAKRQQNAAMTWIRKKYQKVITMEIPGGSDVWEKTVSLIGSKNSNSPNDTYTVSEVNNDAQLGRDVQLYQFFRIRGVAIKMIFPMPTNVDSSPVQWSIGYSMNEVLYPQIQPERLQTLATYQTGSCNQNKPISRFYNTAKTYRRFGI